MFSGNLHGLICRMISGIFGDFAKLARLYLSEDMPDSDLFVGRISPYIRENPSVEGFTRTCLSLIGLSP